MKMETRSGAATILLVSILSACTSPDTPANSASIENSCINPTEIAKQTIVSDQEIRFELRNGEVWVNKLPRVCPGLKFQQGFTWEVSGTLVCSNQQRITVKDEGTPCQLGEFTRQPKAS
ncbi:MAG: hypothetical protein Q8R02_03620 [Hyphomonadaceae bacterium]|nr:hypothetical protein [Hyphomonadaceae bacterium]